MKNHSLRRAAIALAACAAVAGSVNVWVEARGAARIRSLDGVADADAVIVLGARVYADGSVSPMLADRLDTALSLYARGRRRASWSPGTTAPSPTTRSTRCDATSRAGVPPEHVFMDHAGFTTYDTLYRARDVFGVRRAVKSPSGFISRARSSWPTRWGSTPTGSWRSTPLHPQEPRAFQRARRSAPR
ncbi:MAG: YdcF family protein [Deltaproteobacteria bacterium]|nr:YdcF family protein [Deltaproteobacteria bacterium]